MGAYYDFIMESSSGSFSDVFSFTWRQKLSELNFECTNAMQLRIGNQLRPKLSCWGAAIGVQCINDIDVARIAETAAYVEMLHKASIIIDDMIDRDTARHGQHTFHIQYGTDTAIIFSLLLIAKGMEGINRLFNDKSYLCDGVGLFANTICKMAKGGLRELELNQTTQYDLHAIREIIDFETVSLIKNSLLIGYWTSKNVITQVGETIERIGKNSGYIFQIFNDLEPFSCIDKNALYKGGSNIDLNRNRKNIVAAYIYGAASQSEKRRMKNLFGDEQQSYLLSLYRKYSILEIILNECNVLENDIKDQIKYLAPYCTPLCLDDFLLFVEKMISICHSKLW